MGRLADSLEKVRMRGRREGLRLRGRLSARQLQCITPPLRTNGVLLFATMRNERRRLPEFFDHYRRLGVRQFFVVDNASTDGTGDWLAAQNDVALWWTDRSYRAARFGSDWLSALRDRYGHDRWCLTVDADELLVYPNHDTRPLSALGQWLLSRGRRSFSALLLDVYAGPDAAWRGGPGAQGVLSAQPAWFDHRNYRAQPDGQFWNDWIQGGVRERAFFAAVPSRAPALNKVPFVRWRRGDAYVSSTHHLLPRGLNRRLATIPTGILLHTKLLDNLTTRATEEVRRQEHYGNTFEYRAYLAQRVRPGDLHHDGATRLAGWRQLEALGLMSRGIWA